MKSFKNMFIILIVLVTFLCMFMCCQQEETKKESDGIESGFSLSPGEPMPELSLGYRSNTREFDLDNLILEVGYGWLTSEEFILEQNTLNYELNVVNMAREDDYYILSQIPCFNSLDYICNYKNNRIEYAHTEFIKIPSELLYGDKGEIRISIKDADDPSKSYGGGYDVFIYTKIGGNRVRIDGWWAKYTNN